jgi:hypothetical protein
MQLPQSGIALQFRQLDGHCEAMLAELPRGRPLAAGLAALRALAEDASGAPFAPEALALTDYECALAGLRIAEIGASVAAAPECPHCGEQMELTFSLADLADEVRATATAGQRALPDDAQGLRLPTAADAAAVEGDPEGPQRMLAACLPKGLSSKQRTRAAQAVEAALPLLSRTIEAPCAACGEPIAAQFHLPGFVLAELMWRAGSVFADVHVLARGYGWSEAQILDLPRERRRRYAALLREDA